MLVHNGENYELRYNVNRVTMIEQAIKKPLVQVLQQGAMSLAEIKVCVAYGLVKEGSHSHILPKKGAEIADVLLNERGSYQKLSDEIADAIERDCGFFFPKDL